VCICVCEGGSVCEKGSECVPVCLCMYVGLRGGVCERECGFVCVR